MKLLGLDRIQLMYLHDPEHTTFAAAMAPGGPVETLVKMKDEGLIEHLGVAGGPIPMEIRYVETGLFEVVITHNRYTMIDQTAAPLLDVAHARGIGVVNAAPYGSGLLALGPDAYPRYMYQDRRRPTCSIRRAPSKRRVSGTAFRCASPPCNTACATHASIARSSA